MTGAEPVLGDHHGVGVAHLDDVADRVVETAQPVPAEAGADAAVRPAVSRFAHVLARLRAVHPAAWVVAVLVFVYVRYAAGLTIRNHEGMGTFGFDYGLYDQGVWLLSRFEAPFVTIMGRNLFGDHTSFILLPFVPVYWVFADGRALLFAQAAALGLGAVPVYLIARRRLASPAMAAGFAAAYLCHPAVAWTNVEQFHPDAFGPPLLGFAFWAMLTERWRAFFVFAVALTMVKEDMVLVVLPLALYCAWKHNRRAGAWLAVWTVAWSLLCVLVILRTLNGVGSLNGWRIPYGGPKGFLETTLKQPGVVYDYFRSENRPWYVWQVLFPVAFLAVLSPAVLGLGLLTLASNLVSTFWYQHQIQYHYSVMLAPAVVLAAVYAVARLRTARGRATATAAVVLCAVWGGYLWGPFPVSRRPTVFARPEAAYVANARAVLSQVPDDAVVSAFYGYVPQLTHRKEIYQFPVPFKAEYWGTFRQEGQELRHLTPRIEYIAVPVDLGEEPKRVFERVKPEFALVAQVGSAQLYKRVRPPSPTTSAPAATTTDAPAGTSAGPTAPASVPATPVVGTAPAVTAPAATAPAGSTAPPGAAAAP